MMDIPPAEQLLIITGAREAGHLLGTRVSLRWPAQRVGVAHTVPDAAVEPLVDIALEFVAELVQPFINAGSERDVFMEDEQLRAALDQAIREWSTTAAIKEEER